MSSWVPHYPQFQHSQQPTQYPTLFNKYLLHDSLVPSAIPHARPTAEHKQTGPFHDNQAIKFMTGAFQAAKTSWGIE